MKLALHLKENLKYDNQVRNAIVDSAPASPEPQPEAAKLNTRVVELLSDEEDQDAIENDPTKLFTENHLELLVLRSRVKSEPELVAQVLSREKRSRVIESQLRFDKKCAAKDIQQAVQDGYLENAASAYRSHRSLLITQSHSNNFIEGSAMTHEQQYVSERTSTAQSSSSSSSDDESSDEFFLGPGELSPSLDETEPEGLNHQVVAEPTSKTTSACDRPVTFGTSKLFPLILPKSSQNISPIKLLQTHLKRADKQSREEFKDNGRTLILRFSSAKVTRRKLVIEDRSYDFPDEDTARNFLSLKALFSVPELCAEKAGSRFSGVFRAAWHLLEDEASEVRKGLIAGKVQTVREIARSRTESLQMRTSKVEPASSLMTSARAPFKCESRNLHMNEVFQTWSKLQASEAYASMYEYRRSLPIAAFRNSLLASIQNNQVTILCGETGCGKSTQLPTFILENELSQSNQCKIYVTEPRRISAISLANRVSAELGENKKAISTGDSLLGFSIRLDSQISDKSRLIYATTGIVLRMLEENKELAGITHLIIDEVHERSIDSDFLLIVVKRLIRHRRDLKVVLMSATLQADRFNEYFGGHCCIFNVPGRTYPVEQYFLEDAIESSGYICDENGQYAKKGVIDLNNDWEIPDEQDDESGCDADLVTYSDRTLTALKILDPYKVNFDLICILLDHLEQTFDRSITQAILIFLPGMGEIRRLMDSLQAHKRFGDRRQWVLYALHSSISSDKQQAAFDVPANGVRKIVIATNIAETGITIPDITCVIDTGKHKESRFDSRRQLSKLVETFIAKANARQRMGRAGRVQAGVCFHLFSRARFEKMTEHQLPEFQRLNLDELALRVKTVQLGGIEEVLLEALDAPSPENVKRSINNLIEVGALDESQNLTPLGKHLARLPVGATLGKLILFGVRYSCLDACLVIAAILSSKSPFEMPIGREREAISAKQAFVRGDSDFLTMWTAYARWRAVCQERPHHETKFCRDSFLSVKGLSAIEELRLQYVKILVESGLITASDADRRGIQKARFISSRDGFVTLPSSMTDNVNINSFIEICLTSAFYPNLINFEDGLRTISKGQPVTIHSSSINSHARNLPKRWIVFYNLLKTKVATNAHDTGLVDDYIVALFCGSTFDAMPYSGTISIDHNRIKFATRDLRTLVAITILRQNLERQFSKFLDHENVQDEWLDILSDLVSIFEAAAKQRLR